jgi:tetratricopeptide (TPR) repeat protein
MHRIAICLALATLSLGLPVATAAQTTAVSGQILKSGGASWTNLRVEILNVATGEVYAVTTDKDGRYSQWGLRPGPYKISLVDRSNPSFAYSETHDLRGPEENDVSINFSRSPAPARGQRGSDREEDAARFNAVKAHFNSATGAMQDAESLCAELPAAPPDQRSEIQRKLAADYQTAIEQFQLAEQAGPRLDANTHAMVLNNLANAYDFSGNAADAISTYERAVELSPEAVAYENLAKLQANRTVTRAAPVDLSDPSASCTNAASIDPVIGAKCWRNLGIIFDNSSKLSAAAISWRNATALDPKDAQAWLQLGETLLRTVEFKHDAVKVVPVFPAEAAAALQKCIVADPAGPYAEQAKLLLTELASYQFAGTTAASNPPK